MKKLTAKILAITLLLSGFLSALSPVAVFADGEEAAKTNCVDTSLFGQVCDDGQGGSIFQILNIVLTIMTFGVGILGTLGIVIAGIQYASAKDNEQQMAKAKMRIIQIVIGMVIWATLYVALKWLLPGFGNS